MAVGFAFLTGKGVVQIAAAEIPVGLSTVGDDIARIRNALPRS
jgi:hypothetical protein